MGKRYIANFHYFDKINTPNKAYWLGFIWADGYVAKRLRKQPNGTVRIEYNLKLSLNQGDASHIKKFLKDIESNYPINFYESKGFTLEDKKIEARAFITNIYMCKFLYEDLGIQPRRTDASKVIKHIPEYLYKYFILGLFDADGSFSAYSGNNYGDKLNVIFGGSELVLRFIENYLSENSLTNSKVNVHKLSQRHEGKDGGWLSLRYSGKAQGMKILDYLYDSPIYLDRKYNKYLNIPYHNKQQ